MTKNSQSAWKWDPWLLEVDMPSTKHPTLAISLKNTDWRTWKSTGDSLFGDITQPCVDRVRWDASPGSLKRPCMVIWAWDPRDDFGKSSIKWACLVHISAYGAFCMALAQSGTFSSKFSSNFQLLLWSLYLYEISQYCYHTPTQKAVV